MDNIDSKINVFSEIERSLVEQIVEESCAAVGVTLTLKGTLAKYPGCFHWHVKQGSERGTLEITYWRDQIWYKVNASRHGSWIDTAVQHLTELIRAKLDNATKNNSQ
jgi:hypothetical protein